MDFKKNLLQRGWLGTLKYVVRSFLGIEKMQKEVDTLFYFLNEYIEPSALPPTKDEGLRLLQLCDAQLLIIFDRICRKHHFQYWLDYGTLLGAVRHRGFIPWDDDMDISMPRNDYNRFIAKIPKEFELYGLDVTVEPGRIGIGFKHSQTGVWLDVFPADVFYHHSDWSKIRSELDCIYPSYRKACVKNDNVSFSSAERMFHQFFHDYLQGSNPFYLLSVTFKGNHRIYAVEQQTLFPLQNILFEGASFPAPANVSVYLSEIYGPSFDKLPRSGILQHGAAAGRRPLSLWASDNEVDMNEVLSYLKSVADKIN